MKYQVFVFIAILNIKLASSFFVLDIKKRAIDRLTKEVFPFIQKELNKQIRLPDQKVHGIKITDQQLNLEINNLPIIDLQSDLNRIMFIITDVGAMAKATLKVKIIKEVSEETNFYIKLKSIGFSMKMNASEEEPRVFQNIVKFDHIDLECESIEIVFENSKLNYLLQNMYKINFLDVKNYLCKEQKKVIKDSAEKMAEHFLNHGLTERLNSFLPLDLPVSKKYFIHLEIAEDVKIKEKNVSVKLKSEVQNIDKSNFHKNCRDDNFNFFDQVPINSDFSIQIPECYVGDFINLLSNEDKGLAFPSIEYDFEGQRIDIMAVVEESPEHVVWAREGYISIIADSTLKIVHEGKIYEFDTFAECTIHINKLNALTVDHSTGDEIKVREFTNNKHIHFTDMNIGVFQAKMTLINLKEYNIKENSEKLPDNIPLNKIVDFYSNSNVQLHKKQVINRQCTMVGICFDNMNFELTDNMILVSVGFNDVQ